MLVPGASSGFISRERPQNWAWCPAAIVNLSHSREEEAAGLGLKRGLTKDIREEKAGHIIHEGKISQLAENHGRIVAFYEWVRAAKAPQQ